MKEDLRITKTKQSIKQAFFDLMKEKPIEKISVNDITSLAQINRSTFYLHYRDKYQLFESLEDEFVADIKVILDTVTHEQLNNALKTHQTFPHVLCILKYIKEHDIFFILISKNNTWTSFFDKVSKLIFHSISRLFPNLSLSPIQQKYYLSIASSMFSSVLLKWVDTGMEESPEDMADMLSSIMRVTLEQIYIGETL